MSERFIRSLTVLADGSEITGYSRVRLTGSERMGLRLDLFPWLFTLRFLNLSEDGWLALSRCRTVTVMSGDAELVSGAFADSARTVSPRGRITTVCFSPGLPLWQADVSLSVDAGATVRETVARLLAASGTGTELLTSEGMEQAFARPQAFCGRAAECIEEALSVSAARYFTYSNSITLDLAPSTQYLITIGSGAATHQGLWFGIVSPAGNPYFFAAEKGDSITLSTAKNKVTFTNSSSRACYGSLMVTSVRS